jgi:8-oxo-dGTP diphosphatase
MSAIEKPETGVIEAAGGLLWKNTPEGRKLALVHRAYYDDWSLPKGKREPGESWQETARREVREETGCTPRIESFAGSTAYLVKGVAKVVLFWNMTLAEDCDFKPDSEVDRLEWLSPAEALAKLSYANERAVVEADNYSAEGR